jgi:cell fate (sporulation/competence/biofilm development) regulator YlbF (YheA/YmcA/DUF963 family)
MNDGFSRHLKELKEVILDDPRVKNYLKLKSAVINDKRLNSLKNEMEYQRSCNIDASARKRYYDLKKEYEEDPLVENYKVAKEELRKFIEEIEEGLKS